MNTNKLNQLLESYKNNEISKEDLIDFLKSAPFKDIDFAKVDTHRFIRQGFSEAVYCPGKTAEQIIEIMKELKKHNPIVLATRAKKQIAKSVLKEIPDAEFIKEAKIIKLGNFPKPKSPNYALVITAGTADIPVAQEAIVTIKSNGVKVKSLFDCGVAGVQRFFSNIDVIQQAKAIVVIAGMEGALASLVGGVSACPVIAVPTSRGYGANFDGLAPLLAMLNSCTSCVSTVNIDNGYSAGTIASLIIHQSKD
jgi:NCAIR mutase (PurE)-related protein